MNLYEIMSIENAIEDRAKANDGEISEDDLKTLVEANTSSLTKVENLCKYIRHLELGIETCKTEENRIKEMRQKAEKRIKSIKKYMTPYVKMKGKIDAGTFKLSTRVSKSVNLSDDFYNLYGQIESEYMEKKVEMVPDKKKIKQDLEDGNEIPGASLYIKDNLQLK